MKLILLEKYLVPFLEAYECAAQNHIFPSALAVVESEKKDSWTWFIVQMQDRIVSMMYRLKIVQPCQTNSVLTRVKVIVVACSTLTFISYYMRRHDMTLHSYISGQATLLARCRIHLDITFQVFKTVFVDSLPCQGSFNLSSLKK